MSSTCEVYQRVVTLVYSRGRKVRFLDTKPACGSRSTKEPRVAGVEKPEGGWS